MQAMQYNIKLPTDYDMNIIRERVKKTGGLMDGFEDLFFKAYLISERSNKQLYNSYCPLYVWKNTSGMTKFIFDGYFDNILNSFGWQNIEIGVTSSVELSDNFDTSKFVTLEVLDIEPSRSLKEFTIHEALQDGENGKVVIYNPDKWKKNIFTFYSNKPDNQLATFEILHISK
ncbi:MAG: DUF4865 family protein [Streptococcus sp.]|nr:DUF4865 family protein [Streptococcus sp.]